MSGPLVPRELRVVYGAVTVGGAADYLLDSGDDGEDRLVIDKTFSRTVVRFWVLTADHASDAAFNTACAALETAFTRPRLRLQVQQGPAFAETLVDLDPAEASGIDVDARIVKYGSPYDTGRSRRYLVEIVSGNPANQTATIAGEAGLRDFASTVRHLPSGLRSLEVRGTYTKLASAAAMTQYEAQIATRVSAITGALTGTGTPLGTWDAKPSAREDTPNLEGSLVVFRRVYDEIKLRQSLAAVDDPNVRGSHLEINVSRDGSPGDDPFDTYGPVQRLVVVIASYDVWLDIALGTTCSAWWESVGRPWVTSHAGNASQTAALVRVKEDARFDDGVMHMTATVVYFGGSGGGDLERTITTRDERAYNPAIVPAWNKDPLAAWSYPAPHVVTRTTLVRRVARGIVGPAGSSSGRGARPGGLGIFAIGSNVSLQFSGGLGAFAIGGSLSTASSGPIGGETWEPLSWSTVSTPKRKGVFPERFDVTEIEDVKTERLIHKLPASGGSSASTGGGAGRVASPGGG